MKMKQQRFGWPTCSGASMILAVSIVVGIGGCGAGDDASSGGISPAGSERVGTAPQAAQTCVTFQRGVNGNVYDDTIQQQSPWLNQGASPTLVAGTTAAATHQQTLLEFDLSSIPSSAV